MSDEMNEVIKRVQDLGCATSKEIPEWLSYGSVCVHDDGWLCNHRLEYLIQTMQGLKPEFKHIKDI